MKRSLHFKFYLLPLFLLITNTKVEAQSCAPDIIPPVFVECDPTFTAELPASGVFEFVPEMFAVAQDDCTTDEDLVYTFSPSQVTCSDIGSSIQVITSVVDESGNLSQCQTLVFVEDNLLPILFCQNSLTVRLDQNGGIALNADLLLLSAIENCNLSFTINPSVFDCSDVDADVWVEVIATDQSGNKDTCYTLVSIADRTPPTISCVPNLTINLPETGVVTLEPSLFNVVVNDNCTLSDNIDLSINPTSVDCSDVLSPLNVVITATDQSGNEEICVTTVTVVDISAPIISCQPQINIILPPSGQMNVDPQSVLLSSTDNCTANVDLVFFVTPSSVNCSYIGDTAVAELTVEDESGNASTCQFLIIVEDIMPPNLNCNDGVAIELNPDGEFQLSPDLLVSSVSDNCSFDITLSRNTVSCKNAGKVVPIKVKAEDDSGNKTKCTSYVDVLDPSPESIFINGPSSIECGERRVRFSVNVNGGYAPFTYEWEIAGGVRSGWEIVSGQGTPNILVNAGTKRSNLKVIVTDLCGKKNTDKFRIKCNNSRRTLNQMDVDQIGHFTESDVNVYPNPVVDEFVLELPEDIINTLVEAYVINNNCQLINMNGFEQRIVNHLPISIRHLMDGVYSVIIVTSDKGVIVKRFVKM